MNGEFCGTAADYLEARVKRLEERVDEVIACLDRLNNAFDVYAQVINKRLDNEQFRTP